MTDRIDPERFGVSFSIKQCRNFGLDPQATLQWLLDQGWRRFRLMSYWNEHETEQGTLDFYEFDRQIDMIKAASGVVTLCLGAKQPRWPEYHWPKWAWEASKQERDAALISYVETVVKRYQADPIVLSWQLENEALLRGFGVTIEIDRQRLRREYLAVKALDRTRPIIMSTSNGWGLPLRSPRPDVIGFSYYPTMFQNGHYKPTIQKPWFEKLRRLSGKLLLGKPIFIHELQCEPWGPTAIWKMDTAEQDRSMSAGQITHNIAAAERIGGHPIDLWGAEWWYWRHLQGDDSIQQTVRSSVMTGAKAVQ